MSSLKSLIESEMETVFCKDGEVALPTFFLKMTFYYKIVKSGNWSSDKITVDLQSKDLIDFRKALENAIYTPHKKLCLQDYSWLNAASYLILEDDMLKRTIGCIFNEITFDVDLYFSILKDFGDVRIKKILTEYLDFLLKGISKRRLFPKPNFFT